MKGFRNDSYISSPFPKLLGAMLSTGAAAGQRLSMGGVRHPVLNLFNNERVCERLSLFCVASEVGGLGSLESGNQ